MGERDLHRGKGERGLIQGRRRVKWERGTYTWERGTCTWARGTYKQEVLYCQV